jgi:hypothetical protein
VFIHVPLIILSAGQLSLVYVAFDHQYVSVLADAWLKQEQCRALHEKNRLAHHKVARDKYLKELFKQLPQK